MHFDKHIIAEKAASGQLIPDNECGAHKHHVATTARHNCTPSRLDLLQQDNPTQISYNRVIASYKKGQTPHRWPNCYTTCLPALRLCSFQYVHIHSIFRITAGPAPPGPGRKTKIQSRHSVELGQGQPSMPLVAAVGRPKANLSVTARGVFS